MKLVVISLVCSLSYGLTFSTALSAPCDKPAGYVWTHAFYHDKDGNVLQVEELEPNQDLSDRTLKRIGNRDVPGCSPGAYEQYSCPGGSEAWVDRSADIAVYYARKTGSDNVNAYCYEKVRNAARKILCASDPDDGNPACTFCYCLSRPCPPVCCR
jgi:hypothetical protein